MPGRPTAATVRAVRRAHVGRISGRQGGIVSRRQLYALGLTRAMVRAEVRSGRWRKAGRQTIQVTPPTALGLAWRAVFEIGPSAAIDGVTSLQQAGLVGFTSDRIHVSVPKSARYRRLRGVHIHETRRRASGDLTDSALPTVAPEIAAVRAALWARSGREAALVLAMSVQQRLIDRGRLWTAVESVRRDKRRGLIRAVTRDVLAGAESLGELDFARMCRKRGLPEPDRQQVRTMPDGRAYLDNEFRRYGAVVEIDGVQHLSADHHVDDLLRQNEVTLGEAKVLRIPLLGLRVAEDAFMDQVVRLLIQNGWLPGH